MQDSDDNQNRSQEKKSLLATIIDGVENVNKVKDFADSVMKFETLDMKVNRMKRKFEALESREKDINEDLKYEESLSLKRPSNEVQNWLKNFDEIKAKVRRTEKDVEESKEKLFPSLHLPGNLDRLTAEIGELYDQREFSRGLTLEAQQSRGLEFPTTRLFGQMFQENKNLILESLNVDNVLSIGVYGMGGVGKTTLLKHVNNEIVQNFPDTSVLWVTVMQKYKIKKLQDDITRKLGSGFREKDNVMERAAELSQFMKKRKNTVLILDDVWEDINLDEIGISLCVNGCKMILTTRLLDVCNNMDCQMKVRVVPLIWEEAWDLFRNKLGDDLELTPMIKKVAEPLVKECAGLPLGIITMARSMKHVDDVYEWKDKLENMMESKLEHDNMEKKVFQVLKCSYDMLRDPKVQQCFLDCALYPEDHSIRRVELIELFIDERLIDGMKNREREICRGQTILNKLVDACLLDGFNIQGQRYVKMHDLVRDMALQITRTNPRFLVQARMKLKEIPDENEWVEDLVKVSLMYNELSNISFTTSLPSCPSITTLMLNSNTQLERISYSFFKQMMGLNVLDMSYTKTETLPNSICYLVNLSALLLKGCKQLRSLPSLANLKELRRLDLSHSGIINLPLGLEVLPKLKYLNLFTRSLQIQLGVLANLVRLQLLELDLHYSKIVRVICEELSRLERLEMLKVQFHNVDDLNTYVESFKERKLVNYIFEVGFEVSFRMGREYTKNIILSNSEILNSAYWDHPLLLPQDIQVLYIKNCKMVISLSEATALDKITNLTTCHISNCEGIENLLYASSSHSSPLLQTLKVLNLCNLKNFRALINDNQSVSSLRPRGTFSSLKVISINHCPMIKKLFTPALISLFQNLERMEVSYCEKMEEIIGASSDGDREGVNLPKLKSLHLSLLYGLTSFCDEQTTLTANSLQEIRIWHCFSLKLSFLDAEICPFPSLKKIMVGEDWWNLLKWDHPRAKDVLRPFVSFIK